MRVRMISNCHIALALIGACAAVSCSSKGRTQQRSQTIEASYVRPGICQSCHARIFETYQRVGMAQAFSRPTDSNVIEDYKKNNRFFHAASGRHYEMVRRDGRFFQRRWETDSAGAAVNVFEREVLKCANNGSRATQPVSAECTHDGDRRGSAWPIFADHEVACADVK